MARRTPLRRDSIQTTTSIPETTSVSPSVSREDSDRPKNPQCLVREYDGSDQSNDLEDMLHVFRVTAGVAIQTPECLEIGSYIWCRPYMMLSPRTCFVLEVVTGVPTSRKVVGYIIGTSHVPDFISSWQRDFLSSLPSELQATPAGAAKRYWSTDRPMALRYRLHHPEDQLHPELPLLMQDYPAHLHIDILPEYQGKGYGSLLMTTFLQRLSELDVRGVHLIMAKDNIGAGLFYEKLEFKRLPVVMDGGESGELGIDKTSIWWCRRL